jgi:mRNA interferase MazF
VSTSFRRKEGLVPPDQIRAIDRRRFIRRLGDLDPATLAAVLGIMQAMFA